MMQFMSKIRAKGLVWVISWSLVFPGFPQFRRVHGSQPGLPCLP